MKKEVWGPSIWYLFHTIAEKIPEEEFLNEKNNLFLMVEIVSKYLPCPLCCDHSRKYLIKINKKYINTKNQFKIFLLNFHNNVNITLKKPVFTEEELNNKYKTANLIKIINNFKIVYNYNVYNEKMISNKLYKNMDNKKLYPALNSIINKCIYN